ncbi:MAG: hypothetical protein ACJA0U_003317 [Salibacteraceae bacterium]|jgi:hypothetical protein
MYRPKFDGLSFLTAEEKAKLLKTGVNTGAQKTQVYRFDYLA